MPDSDHQPAHSDDSLMDRFDRTRTRRFSARTTVLAVILGGLILVVCAGPSIRKEGLQEKNGLARTAVLAVGDPANWIAGKLPFHSAADSATGWLGSNENLNGLQGFSYAQASSTSLAPVTQNQFDAPAIGDAKAQKTRLRSLLVTGDSMSEPLDQYVAQRLEPDGVKVTQDPHIGTGISSTILVDWAKLAQYQVKKYHPQAVVIFIGANDGYSMAGPGGTQVACCSVAWATIYANRVRQMMNTYRQDGVAKVYWLTLPTPRDTAHAQIAENVNAAIKVAAQPWANQIRVVDTVPTFSPGNHYRDSMTVGGVKTIVRQSDGIHLNNAGSQLAASIVLGDARSDFTW